MLAMILGELATRKSDWLDWKLATWRYLAGAAEELVAEPGGADAEAAVGRRRLQAVDFGQQADQLVLVERRQAGEGVLVQQAAQVGLHQDRRRILQVDAALARPLDLRRRRQLPRRPLRHRLDVEARDRRQHLAHRRLLYQTQKCIHHHHHEQRFIHHFSENS